MKVDFSLGLLSYESMLEFIMLLLWQKEDDNELNEIFRLKDDIIFKLKTSSERV